MSDQPPFLRVIAEALLELSNEIDELGSSLCQDDAIVACIMTELQGIDLVVQKQRHLAALLLAPDWNGALNEMTLETYRTRLIEMIDAHCDQTSPSMGKS